MNKFHNLIFEMKEHSHPNERSFELLKMFHKHFPAEVSQLFRYSRLDDSFSGVLQYKHPDVKSLQHIHEYMMMNEHIHRELKANEVRFFNDNHLQISIGGQHIVPVIIDNLFLVPISVNDVVIAFFTGINVDFDVTEENVHKADDFRLAITELLSHGSPKAKNSFSDKEIAIIKYISFGYTTNEIARSMNFSEANIKYFIKNVMDKTNSKNRTEAVSKLFRLGLLN